MTITSTQLSVTWVGNGSTQTFTYPFLIPSPGQCVLTSTTNGVTTTIARGLFSISNTGNATGGTLTYPLTGGPIPAGTTLTLTRKVPYQQAFHPAVNGPIYNPTLESALDALAMQIMQTASGLGQFTINGGVVTSANFTGALSVSVANGVATVNVQTTPGPIGPQGVQGPVGATGPQGVRGSLWYDGSGAPGAIAGTIAGDQYLDTVTGNVYQLGSGGAWTKTADIMGPQGQQGIQGATGAGSSVLVNNGSTVLGAATTIEADGTTLQATLAGGVVTFKVIGGGSSGGTPAIMQKNSNSYPNNGNGTTKLQLANPPASGNYILFLVISGGGDSDSVGSGTTKLFSVNPFGNTWLSVYGGYASALVANPYVNINSSSGSVFEIENVSAVNIAEASFTTSGGGPYEATYIIPGALSDSILFWFINNYGAASGNTPTLSNVLPTGSVVDYNTYNNSSECFQQFHTPVLNTAAGETIGFTTTNSPSTYPEFCVVQVT